MSAFVVLDTHRFVKNLVGNGFTERQAEALAEERVTLHTGRPAAEAGTGTVKMAGDAPRAATGAETATPPAATDIKQLEVETRSDIEQSLVEIEGAIDEFRVDIAGRIEAFKAELLKWWIGALIVQAAVIVTLVRLLL